jgi:hypothetical protein
MKFTLKNIKVSCLILFLIIYFSGCASTGFLMASPNVTMFGNTYPSKSEDANIDVYMTALPSKEYIEFAQITCGDTDDSWNMKQILKEARRIGADGVIITGKTGTWGVGNSTYAVSEQYGITAIAIKYKNSSH